MCVERTARTKLPSARGSRASVARQKRAAARGEMLDTVDALLGFMVFIGVAVNTVKITQAANQFYPETCGKAHLEKVVEIPLPHAFSDEESAQASPDAGRAILAGSGS